MSFGVLLLSVIFAGIQVGVSWLLLAFEPVAAVFANIPVWVITGVVFALGMLLSFVLIFVIGAAQITDKAADFVRDHFGRAMVLMLVSVLLICGLGCGAELLYQVEPIYVPRYIEMPADVCFVLDYSNSMTWYGGDEALRSAFEGTVNSMEDGQQISVVAYESSATTLQDWTEIDASSRSSVINAVNQHPSTGGTDFANALKEAGVHVQKSIDAGRACVVIMISDGGDGGFTDVKSTAPVITNNNVPVYTIGLGGDDYIDLKDIASETGGEFTQSAIDADSFEKILVDINEKAKVQVNVDTPIPDTLVTPRYEGRSGLINPMAMRLILLFLVSFIFKLIVNVCIGNNDRSLGAHLLFSLVFALISAAVVEFGYMFGLPMLAVCSVYWVLMMGQIVLTDR